MSGLANLPFTIVYGLYMNNNIGQSSNKTCFARIGLDNPMVYDGDTEYATLAAMGGVENVTESFHMVMKFGFWAYLLTNLLGNVNPKEQATVMLAGCTGLVTLA